MTPSQKMPDICEHGRRIKQENLYHMGIQEILYSKGWVKLPYDSLWFHPIHGTWIVVYALYLATKPEKESKLKKFWQYGLWFLVGSLATFLIGKLL